MSRSLIITETGGVYTAHTKTEVFKARRLEDLIERLDPGVPQSNVAHAAGIIERILGPKDEGDHGQIRQGLVGV